MKYHIVSVPQHLQVLLIQFEHQPKTLHIPRFIPLVIHVLYPLVSEFSHLATSVCNPAYL